MIIESSRCYFYIMQCYIIGMMESIRQIFCEDFSEVSLNRLKHMNGQLSDRIQPWQDPSSQLAKQNTQRKLDSRQLLATRKKRHRCHKTAERQTPFVVETDQDMHQSLKWTLQSQLFYKKQKKFSHMLKMKNNGHFRSNTLQPQENSEENINRRGRKMSFNKIYDILNSIQKNSRIESRLEKKPLTCERKPIPQKLSSSNKQKWVCPAIIQLSERSLQKVPKNNFYKSKASKPKQCQQINYNTIQSFKIKNYQAT